MDLPHFLDRWRRCLFGRDAECQAALQYLLEHRRLRRDWIERVPLGYCPRTESLPRVLEFVRDRIVVPIRSCAGDLLAFAARSPRTAGWRNSHGTDSFTKGEHLFWLDQSGEAIFDQDKAYVLEGYFDAIVLSQEGLPHCCSLMGTTLSRRHIGLLKRYCNRICFCFDQDANQAGQQAQWRSVAECARFRFDQISVVELPVGVDPDEFVLANGRESFLARERVLDDLAVAECKRLCGEQGGARR